MEGQDQEKFVTVSGPVEAVAEMLNRLASADEPLNPDVEV